MCIEQVPAEAWPTVETPEIREQLENLDDAMFAAIAGNPGAVEKARALWFDAVASVPWELVDESREQYLRYAAEVARRFDAGEVRNPATALAAIEIIELLARED